MKNASLPGFWQPGRDAWYHLQNCFVYSSHRVINLPLQPGKEKDRITAVNTKWGAGT